MIRHQSKFTLLFEQIMKDLTKESGNVAGELADGILRENIQPTIDYFEQLILLPLGITQDDWTSEIGSTGKKDKSGDIDIAINTTEIAKKLNFKAPEDVLFAVKDKLEANNFIVKFGDKSKATGTLNCVFPIKGPSQQNEYVQIDLFPSTSLKFAKFNRHAPAQGTSKYKGSVRSLFVGGMMKVITLAAVNDGLPDYLPADFVNKPFISPRGSKYPGLVFSYGSMTDNGLNNSVKTWVGKRVPIRNNPEEIRRSTLYTDPQEMLDGLFGKGKYTVDDFDSFESIWNNVLFDPEFPYADQRDRIIKHMYHVYSLSDQVMPDEITKYMEEHPEDAE